MFILHSVHTVKIGEFWLPESSSLGDILLQQIDENFRSVGAKFSEESAFPDVHFSQKIKIFAFVSVDFFCKSLAMDSISISARIAIF